MENNPYGYCPKCGAPGRQREKRPGGNDICENGCVYPSASAVFPDEEEGQDAFTAETNDEVIQVLGKGK